MRLFVCSSILLTLHYFQIIPDGFSGAILGIIFGTGIGVAFIQDILEMTKG